jgi:hypothetical protein
MTEVSVRGRVGPDTLADGAEAKMRQGKSAEQIVQELHGRWYESNYRGAVFSGGMGFTSISNATYTVGTLGATATPVVGVWNPASSAVNLVILYATLGVGVTALQATGAGPFVWCVSTGNGVISTGAQPLNRKTLALAGSAARDMTNVALTGLTNNLVQRFASSLGGGSNVQAAFLQTQAGAVTPQVSSVEYIEGSIIVPPGGVLALLAAATGVAHSASSGLVWEEVPV